MTSPEEPRSENVVWDHDGVARDERWAAAGQRGATVWFTGLPASGKSTLAKALEHSLLQSGRLAYRLDGDNLRHGLCGDLGFSAEDREENVRRTAQVAKLMADAGVVAIVALVSPYREGRDAARMLHQADHLPFIGVFVDTPLEICEERDPKGLYARARAGELRGMTGVDGAYEPATESELHLRPPWSIAEVVEQIKNAVTASATQGAV